MKGKKKFLKGALAAGMIFSAAVPFNVLAEKPSVTMDEAEKMLSSLSEEQREALEQLEYGPGFVVSPEINTTTPDNVEVIVEFTTAPAKVEMKKEEFKGKKLALGQAQEKVEQSHKEFKGYVSALKKKKGSPVYNTGKIEIKREYKHAFNGVAMTLPGTAVEELLQSGTVQRIWSNAQVQLEFPSDEQPKVEPKMADSIPQIGVDKLHDEGVTGKGIKVGVLDTGIDYTHPDLVDSYKGYRGQEGADPGSVDPDSVKGWDFVNNDADPMETTYDDWKETNYPEYYGGSAFYTSHGTHVSGTIAADKKNNVDYAVKGVAPDVDLYGYKVLGPYGSGATDGVLAGIDKAVADGMDVINLSLGASVNDPLYPTSVAINNAMLSGVVSVVAAGNTGPSEKTVGSPGTSAFGITVGASDAAMSIPTFSADSGEVSIEKMKLMAKGFTDDLKKLEGKTYPLVFSGLGKPEDFDGKDLTGKVALIQRGELTFEAKVQNAKQAGAEAVIIFNNVEGEIPVYIGENTKYIPTFQLSQAEGNKLKALEDITFSKLSEVKTEGDSLADFSSRGPVNSNYDIKPDIVAPGVSVFSTYPEFVNDPEEGLDYTAAYARLNGTSMATPHVAGVAALILEEHPDLDPFDVKTALMNTADDLKNDYSVYEVGTGRVDAYQAVHSDVSFKVLDKTEHIENEEYVEVDDITGSISYGNHYFEDGPIKDSRKIQVANDGSEDQAYNVEIEYHTAREGVKDAVKNDIKIDIPDNLSIKAGGTQEIAAEITVPEDAEEGRYEGYIHVANEENPEDRYQIPFAIRVVEKGIAEVEPLAPSITNNTPFHQYYAPGTHIAFKFNSPMERFDIIMKEADTGKPVGVVGSFDGTNAIPDKEYLVFFGHRGLVYPFTGDKKNPVADYIQKVPEGEYVMELISTDANGNTYHKKSVAVVDNTSPEVKMDIEPGVIEINEDMLTEEDGHQALWVHGTIKDETVDLLQERGFDYTQKSNTAAYYENGSPFISGFLKIEDNGESKFGVLPEEYENNPYQLRLFPWDMATAADYTNSPQYIFMKEGTEYVDSSFDKETIKQGEEVTLTLNLNNVKNFKFGSIGLDFLVGTMEVKDVKVNKEFQAFADQNGAEVELDQPDMTDTSVKVGASLIKEGFEGLNGDMPFLDVTFKLSDDSVRSQSAWVRPDELSYQKHGQAEGTKVPAYNVHALEVIPTRTKLTGNIAPEAFLTPGGYIDNKFDMNKLNAKVYAKNKDGEVFPGTMDNRGLFEIFVPADKDAYTVYAEIPGHLTRVVKVMGSIEEDGEYHGIYWRENPGRNLAGDATGDQIIDIRDIKDAVEQYGTDASGADINQDGKVDEEDVRLIEKNFLEKGQTAGKGAKPKDKLGKKGLSDFLKMIGLSPEKE